MVRCKEGKDQNVTDSLPPFLKFGEHSSCLLYGKTSIVYILLIQQYTAFSLSPPPLQENNRSLFIDLEGNELIVFSNIRLDSALTWNKKDILFQKEGLTFLAVLPG